MAEAPFARWASSAGYLNDARAKAQNRERVRRAGVLSAPVLTALAGLTSSDVLHTREIVTCHLRYEIDPAQLDAFERFAQTWMQLVGGHGGTHHGYFLPSEGASDIAYALFSFPSLAEYERYRNRFGVDPEFVDADRFREVSGCVKRYERTFMRPLLPDQ